MHVTREQTATEEEAYAAGYALAKNLRTPDIRAVGKAADEYEGEIRRAFLDGYRSYKVVGDDDDYLEPDEKYGE